MGKIWFEITPWLISRALRMPDNAEIIGAQAIINSAGYPVIQFIVEAPDLPEHKEGFPIARVDPATSESDFCEKCNQPRKVEWDWRLREQDGNTIAN
jgi:hypothetical protein